MIEAIFCPSGECVALTGITGCSSVPYNFPDECLQKATSIAEMALTLGPLMGGVTCEGSYRDSSVARQQNDTQCLTSYINGTFSNVNYSHRHYIEMELPVSKNTTPYWYEELTEEPCKRVIFALGNFSLSSSSHSIGGAIGIFFILASTVNGVNRFFTSVHNYPFPTSAAPSNTTVNCLTHIALTSFPCVEELHPLDSLRRVLAVNASVGGVDARRASVAMAIELYYTALQHPLHPEDAVVKDDMMDSEEIESLVAELQRWVGVSDRNSADNPMNAAKTNVLLADAFTTLVSVDYKLKDPRTFAGKDILRSADSAAMKQYKKGKKKHNVKNLIRKLRSTFGHRGSKKVPCQIKLGNEFNSRDKTDHLLMSEQCTNEEQDTDNAVEESFNALKCYVHNRLGYIIKEKPFICPDNRMIDDRCHRTNILTRHYHNTHYSTILIMDIGLLQGYEQRPSFRMSVAVSGFAIIYLRTDDIYPISHSYIMSQQIQRALLEAPVMLHKLLYDTFEEDTESSKFSPR